MARYIHRNRRNFILFVRHMTFERIQQRCPRASYSPPVDPAKLWALAERFSKVAEAISPLYQFSDGFESVIRDGEVHLLLVSTAEFELSGQFLVIGTDTCGFGLVVDLSRPENPLSWHCRYSRPIQAENGEPLLESISQLL